MATSIKLQLRKLRAYINILTNNKYEVLHTCSDFTKIDSKDEFSGETFTIHYCTQCCYGKTILPNNFKPEKYYPQILYSTENKDKFFFPFSVLYQKFRGGRALKISKILINKDIFLADIGCGDGSFLLKLQSKGYKNLYGTELSKISSYRAKSRIGSDKVFHSIEELPKKFHCITFFHSLEHFEDVDLILSYAYEILEEGGLLIIEVPNFASLQAMIDRKHWAYNETPRHTHHFSIQVLTDKLSNLGFSVNQIRTLSIEFGFFGMFSSLWNITTGKKNLPLNFLLNKQKVNDIPGLILLSLLSMPLFVFAVLLELLSALFSRGSVISLQARKITLEAPIDTTQKNGAKLKIK
jgi:2-polyprenyl-3-methyl-5-hydroxy-6-metoxy-1,4-benzoquinol methylase